MNAMTLVNAIIDNLCGRSGFDAAFDVDADILESIKQEMADAIDAHLTQPARSVDVEKVQRYTMQYRPDWADNQALMMPAADGEYVRFADLAALTEQGNG